MPGRQSHTAMKRDPDRFLEIKLSATARRLAQENAEHQAAVEEIRTIAVGRTDLLAIAVGHVLGGYLNSLGTQDPRIVRAASLLVEAGAEKAHIRPAVEAVMGRPTHWGR